MIIDEAKQFDGSSANIRLEDYFNLYPEVQLFIDKATAIGPEQDKTKIYSEVYNVSDCSTNIRIKTVLQNNCGRLSCKLIHEECQKLFHPGDRVRLYLDGRCWFCGFIFIRQFESKTSMTIMAFDWLRYFKVPLVYGKNQLLTNNSQQGMPASDIFTKICQDLKIPFEVVTPSTIPVTPQNYTQKTAFNILDFAITDTLINSSEDNRQYFTYYHEPHFTEDDKKDDNSEVKMDETEVFKTSGKVLWQLRNNLTVDALIDDELVYDYSFKESIDEQTYNEIIVYKDQKSYLSKTGKTTKTGKKTGTQIKKVSNDNEKKALWGYLPYFHKAPDGYSEAQMQQIADELKYIFNRPTHSLSVSCYGIIGMRAGYLVPVVLTEIGDANIGKKTWNEKKKDYDLEPVYRTVIECEMIIEYPLKMNLKISSGMYGEVDI